MKIFSDFDGTAAINDVGNLLFRTFAGDRCFEIVQRWKDGKISSKDCLIEECKIARVTRTELKQFCDAQELDPNFVELVHYCRARNVEVEILSDGLDFYIDRILKKYNLDRAV
ncbi:MAG: HAD-IB family phosphatase, partial [bacterium]